MSGRDSSQDVPGGRQGDLGGFVRRGRAERERDEARLAPLATRSSASLGRVRAEPPDELRTCFERDRDRILHSKAFRRLKHKTQVFINPEGDHYVTRLTHALQVTQVARSLAAALGLNEPLTEAIALAHDVGHCPFGHLGEEVLTSHFDGGWHHGAQGVRLYEVLEDLNLTWEVRDGIRAHTWKVSPPPATPEGMCVRFADRIAYLTHDVLDALRARILTLEDVPASVRRHLGDPGSQWIGRMVRAVVDASLANGAVGIRSDTGDCMVELRSFLFARVYHSPVYASEKEMAAAVLSRLVNHLLAHPEDIPSTYRDPKASPMNQVADYVSGMTDRFAFSLHERLLAAGTLEFGGPPRSAERSPDGPVEPHLE